MNIHIPYWLASAIFGFVFCSFLYAVIRRLAMWFFEVRERNHEIAEKEKWDEITQNAIKQIREKHGIQKEA